MIKDKMTRILFAIAATSLVLATLVGCQKKAEEKAAAPAPAAQKPAEDHAAMDHDHDHMHMDKKEDAGSDAGHDGQFPPSSEADKADPNANKLLEPAIEVADVPKDSWYCSMGTVHYYRHEEGDGKCAVCGMPLQHKE